MYTLHDSRLSGNAWKVRILLSQLRLKYRRITHVLADNTTRTPEFLVMNPAGKVPVLILPSGEAIPESNAILWHLAQGTPLVPGGLDQVRVVQWMFFEQSEVLKAFSAARFFTSIATKEEEKKVELAAWRTQASYVLKTLELHLASREFVALARYTIADLALYPYISMAEQGAIDLGPFPHVRSWLARIEAQPGWVPLLEQ
ncbi:glutathione S-transferase family protein [Caenimonas soli]|uniref:glutathione S-transferase family protein n=1 Tax=Caenimonas soli TaxID=2735555 RepID=UPI0015533D5E|nr:glutathione S-transferase family protein [Caenimonas soli]NPC58457.1 glutathione S-transferase family protein [Caenimonas soli]